MNNSFKNMALEAYNEMKNSGELDVVLNGELVGEGFNLKRFIYDITPFPEESFVIGKSVSDELPFALNLYDTTHVLILSKDKESNDKHASFMVNASDEMNEPTTVSRDKRGFYGRSRKVNVHLIDETNMYTRLAEDKVLALASWAYGKKGRIREYNVLLINGLSRFIDTAEIDTVQNLKWLLNQKTEGLVTVVALDDSNRYSEWFKTFIYGDGFYLEKVNKYSYYAKTDSHTGVEKTWMEYSVNYEL